MSDLLATVAARRGVLYLLRRRSVRTPVLGRVVIFSQEFPRMCSTED